MMLLGATTTWRNGSKRLAEGTAGTGPVLSEREIGVAPDRARDPYRGNEVLDYARRVPPFIALCKILDAHWSTEPKKQKFGRKNAHLSWIMALRIRGRATISVSPSTGFEPAHQPFPTATFLSDALMYLKIPFFERGFFREKGAIGGLRPIQARLRGLETDSAKDNI